MTFVDVVNRQIAEFVQQPENIRLKGGTGGYSTPFRGRLFGTLKADAVERLLRRRTVDALWLGSNPCVRRSLANIINPPAGEGDFPEFMRQMGSGLFSSARWDDTGAPIADFNPVQEPQRGWKVYSEVLRRVFGSLHLEGAHPDLLRRAWAFADTLNTLIVTTLSPRLVVVPFSLARDRVINRVHPLGIAMPQARDLRDVEIVTAQGPFRFSIGVCRRGTLTCRCFTSVIRHLFR